MRAGVCAGRGVCGPGSVRAAGVCAVPAQPRPARNPRGIRTAAGTDAAGTDAAVSVRSIDSDRRLALASGG